MNPVGVVAAVGRAIGDGLTLAAEILCPRDHTAEDRLRSWESAAVAVEDEICDEADACDVSEFDPTEWLPYAEESCEKYTGNCSNRCLLPEGHFGACDDDPDMHPDAVYARMFFDQERRRQSSAAVSAAADPSPTIANTSPRVVGGEGSTPDSVIPSTVGVEHPTSPAADRCGRSGGADLDTVAEAARQQQGDQTTHSTVDLLQAVCYLIRDDAPVLTAKIRARVAELQAEQPVREDDLAAHITATRLAWAEQEISDVDLTGAITRSLLADFCITRRA